MPTSVREDPATAADSGEIRCEGGASCMIENRFQRDPPPEWYETGRDRESAMMNDRGETSEIWLRGNMRPAVVMASVFTLVCGGLLAALRWGNPTPTPQMVWLVRGFGAVSAATMAVLLLSASRARLERVGNALRVRLSPFRSDEVPLDVVECFFLGSHPLEQPGTVRDDLPTHRVGTLVVRLAERAVEWHERPTMSEWGTWKEGAIVCDGRLCEPLSADLVHSLTRRLVEAKRSLAAEQAPKGVSSAGQSAGVGP